MVSDSSYYSGPFPLSSFQLPVTQKYRIQPKCWEMIWHVSDLLQNNLWLGVGVGEVVKGVDETRFAKYVDKFLNWLLSTQNFIMLVSLFLSKRFSNSITSENTHDTSDMIGFVTKKLRQHILYHNIVHRLMTNMIAFFFLEPCKFCWFVFPEKPMLFPILD